MVASEGVRMGNPRSGKWYAGPTRADHDGLVGVSDRGVARESR